MANCNCPDGALANSNSLGFDTIDGYPAEHGQFTFTISDYGCDRSDDPDPQALRDILGLPDAGGSAGEATAWFRMGSGIKVDRGSAQWQHWRAYRFDCGCIKNTCNEENGGGTAPAVSSTIQCAADYFQDAAGNYDPNPDKVVLDSKTSLNEDYGVGQGYLFDGQIPNLMVMDRTTQSDHGFDGIPTSGSFNNFVDDYGIIHAAVWRVNGDQIDITFMTQDPRIPGEEQQQGRVVKYGRGFRVYKRGITTITRQIIKATSSGIVILGEGTTQEIGEFQTTFGCDDIQKNDPFIHHLGAGVVDEIEFIIGSITQVEPERQQSNDYVWWPGILSGSENGFRLPGDDLRPLSHVDVQ